MSEREYIVSLNRDVDHVAFNQEMIASTGAGAIPGRTVSVADERATNIRNTHYSLTDAEAEALKNDPRVYGVTLNPDLDPDTGIGVDAVQTGVFTKTTLDRGDFLNWGMRRMNEATNPYSGVNVSGGYNYTLDATGVDVVIVDSGIQADHPEFQDASGVSRVQEIDWFTESGVSGTMPAGHYSDYDGHGTHVAGTVAGKTYGWAKNAKIYSIKLEGLEGSSDPNSGISVTAMADVIIAWHNAKTVDPATGYKRPTVVNHSWGYLRRYDTVTNLTYRGDLKTGTDIDTTAKRWAFGLPPITSLGRYVTNVRIDSVDVDVQLMIDAGIHVCVAAGNRSHKIDVVGGDDYDNFMAANTGSVSYQRGSSPYDDEAYIVGNIDSNPHADGLEQKATSSETGPGVSVYAPGTDIMSAMSTANSFGATVANNPYPANSNFLINNISGTSMASPQIAGMLSLWLQLNPNSTPAQGLAFLSASSKTDQLYDTASSVDYTNTRSLLGSANRFGFNKFNSDTQLRIGTPLSEQAAAPATYALSVNNAIVNEGAQFIITLTTTNVDDGTTVPYTITGVASSDISGSSLTGSFTVNSNTATATFTVAADAITEGTETFLMTLDALSVTQSVTFNDTSLTPAGPYVVTAAANNVDEGSALTFNVTTSNVPDATTLYWTVTNDTDFATSSGSFTITTNSGSFSVTPTSDATTEGAETFTASVRTGSASGTIVGTSGTVTINDTSLTDPSAPTYAATAVADNIDEGSALTINVATTNVTDATTLYWSATNAGDFATSNGSFAITSDAGSFTVTPTSDATTEGAETFQIQIRTGSVSGTVVDTSTAITINDTSLAPTFTARTVTVASGINIYGLGNSYYIAEVAGVSPALSLSEGTTYRFDQSDSSNATHQLLFSTTPNGTHGGGAEYTNGVTKVGTAGQAGAYTEITVAVGAPALHYYCINHSGMGGTANAAAAYTFDATPAELNINEGSALTVNVVTTNVADSTTLYWGVSNAGDFGTSSGSFTVTGNTGSFTVTPTSDATTEGAETFQIQLKTGDTNGTVVDTSPAVTINDTSLAPAADYTINVTNSGNNYTLSGTDRDGSVSGSQPTLAFNNGDVVDFVVSAPSHPFYIKTVQGGGTGNQASGVTNNGTSSGTARWTIGSTGTFYYQCSVHGGMNNSITVS